MNKIVYIKLVVDELEAENARAELFLNAKDCGYDVLESGSREMTKEEVKDAQVAGLIN